MLESEVSQITRVALRPGPSCELEAKRAISKYRLCPCSIYSRNPSHHIPDFDELASIILDAPVKKQTLSLETEIRESGFGGTQSEIDKLVVEVVGEGSAVGVFKGL